MCVDSLEGDFKNSYLGPLPETFNAVDAIEGLRGLIVLGDAWESVDVYYALRHALMEASHFSLAYLAQLRYCELIDLGHGSLVVEEVGSDAEFKKILGAYENGEGSGLEAYRSKEQRRVYGEMREETKLWEKERSDFMLGKLEAGEHPDTHDDFWEGYEERARVTPAESWWIVMKDRRFIPGVVIGLLVGLLVVLTGRHVVKARRAGS